MSDVALEGFGGGGTALNFKVVGGKDVLPAMETGSSSYNGISMVKTDKEVILNGTTTDSVDVNIYGSWGTSGNLYGVFGTSTLTLHVFSKQFSGITLKAYFFRNGSVVASKESATGTITLTSDFWANADGVVLYMTINSGVSFDNTVLMPTLLTDPKTANAKENTIWINTDVKITGYSFAAEQPEEMAKGEVWISTGTASQVAFNALKKDGTVMVYPISAKQMGNDGKLVDVTAKSWQNGEWVDWLRTTYIYANGIEHYQHAVNTSATVTNTGTYLQINTTSGSAWAPIVYWSDIDLTNIKTIGVTLSNVSAGAERYIGVGKIKPEYSTNLSAFNASAEFANTAAEQTVYLDVSNGDISGLYYFYFAIGGNSTARIIEIALIP